MKEQTFYIYKTNHFIKMLPMDQKLNNNNIAYSTVLLAQIYLAFYRYIGQQFSKVDTVSFILKVKKNEAQKSYVNAQCCTPRQCQNKEMSLGLLTQNQMPIDIYQPRITYKPVVNPLVHHQASYKENGTQVFHTKSTQYMEFVTMAMQELRNQIENGQLSQNLVMTGSCYRS